MFSFPLKNYNTIINYTNVAQIEHYFLACHIGTTSGPLKASFRE